MVQAHIIYSGVVQGVGFRLTTQRKAKELHLAGWVRNLSDGRVEILVEGQKDTIQNFILNLDHHFAEYITKKDVHFGTAGQEFRDFAIRMG